MKSVSCSASTRGCATNSRAPSPERARPGAAASSGKVKTLVGAKVTAAMQERNARAAEAAKAKEAAANAAPAEDTTTEA